MVVFLIISMPLSDMQKRTSVTTNSIELKEFSQTELLADNFHDPKNFSLASNYFTDKNF